MVDHVHIANTEIFVKIYRSFLKDGGVLKIDQITQPYIQMNPSLHAKAGTEEIDFPVFMYVFLRLPMVMGEAQHIILGQTDEIFLREGYEVNEWHSVSAPARRRKMMFDGKGTLGVFINSVTDVDDVVCLLTAFQIEWNKIHEKLADLSTEVKQNPDKLKQYLGLDDEMWDKFSKIWKDDAMKWWQIISERALNVDITLLHGSYGDYQKAVRKWLENIIRHAHLKSDDTYSVYFVSSNTHSLVNTITGFVNKVEKELIEYLHEKNMADYLSYWENIKSGVHPGSKENFLWYILKKYEVNHPEVKKRRQAYEKELGIQFIEAQHFLDINAQIISLQTLSKSKDLSAKLGLDTKKLSSSHALILNIDYPLGFGAYMVLSSIFRHLRHVKGVYILGKASFLNGNLGDVGIPSVVYDEYGTNTYFFKNAFTKEYFKEFKSGNVLMNQKLVSTIGTLLHPEEVIKDYFKKGFTIIEMENGPYLDAMYELSNYDRYPENETIDLMNIPIDLGIINYASDTPFTKAITLATRNLGYEGVEATYVSTLAILKRIVEVELQHLQKD